MTPASTDRRVKRRFDLQLPVRYVVRARTRTLLAGEGTTRNLSSGGIAIVTGCEVPAGSSAELWVHWPATAEGIDAIELHIDGRVVRSSAQEIALQARRHHFIVSRGSSITCIPPGAPAEFRKSAGEA
jgi:hypothetical protein